MTPAARIVALSLAMLAACSGTDSSGSETVAPPPVTAVTSIGDDWWLPAWVQPAARSGFYSEFADRDRHVDVRSVDVSWRQIEPVPDAVPIVSLDATGLAQGMAFGTFAEQLAGDDPFWMRLFASAEDWAPTWLADRCNGGTPLPTFGPDDDGQLHLPIWDDCVWAALVELYRAVFAGDAVVPGGLAADERLQFVYAPGAFTWAEYDYDIIGDAVARGALDWPTYRAWYTRMLADLVDVFGEHANKLVFTGEDYPFGPFGADDDLLAAEAVGSGMGVRTGITELFDFHLNEAPAYGSHIRPDGHLVVDESERPPDRVFATENECFNACGYSTVDPYYAVRQSNLKALQLRMNWIYVVPSASYLDAFADHWTWVRLSLGQTATTSADAWAALRDAEDTYWADDPAVRWDVEPYVRNLERWLVQVDRPGCTAHRSDVDVHVGELDEANGTAYEGLSTDVAAGDTGWCLDLDPAFAATTAGDALVKVTYLDDEAAIGDRLDVTWGGGTSGAIAVAGSGEWVTATFPMRADGATLRVNLSGDRDVTVRFVRVIRLDPPPSP